MRFSSLLTRALQVVAGDSLEMASPYGLTPEALAAGLSLDMGFPKWLRQLASGQPGIIRPDETPVEIDTPAGRLRGVRCEGLRIFRGIRYALPPGGERRFAPPEPVPPWTGVQDATTFGPVVSQPGSGEVEDGLFLNVWTPDEAAGKKLPVFVFVHGGAFLFGSGSLQLYEGSALARTGIVVVTVNYRLHTPGFLPTRTTYEQYGTTGNWGLLDVIAALEWVRDNIAVFGGDPDCVTLGGQSAGAFAVSALISSPRAAGLFQQAILQSGGLGSLPAAAPLTGEHLARNILLAQQAMAAAGIEDTPAGLDALRALSVEEVLSLLPPVSGILPPQAANYWPVADGSVIPFRFRQALRQGRLNRVPLLFGSTTDEVSFFLPPEMTETQYRHLARLTFGARADAVMTRYPVSRGDNARSRCCDLANAAGLRAGMFPFADALAAAGLSVYAYRFDAVDPMLRHSSVGVPHASDIKYVFHGFTDELRASPEALADALFVRDAWTNFVKTGDPNRGTKLPVRWEPYTTGDHRELKIGRGTRMEPIFQDDILRFVNDRFAEAEDDDEV